MTPPLLLLPARCGALTGGTPTRLCPLPFPLASPHLTPVPTLALPTSRAIRVRRSSR